MPTPRKDDVMSTVPERFRELAGRWPDQLAFVVDGGGELTFDAWRRGANRVSHGLADRGVGHGDRVVLAFDDDDAIRHAQAYVGVHQLGAVNVLVNTRFARDELHRLLVHAEPSVVLGSRRLQDDLASAGVDVVDWDDLLDGAGDDDPLLEVDEDDPADVLYTAGTTGRPKGVLSRHVNATQAPEQSPQDFQATWWLHAAPLASVAGVSFLLTPAALGMTSLYLPPPFDPERWLELVDEQPVMAAFLAPVQVEQLLGEADPSAHDLSGLAIVSVGSAPIAPATLRAFDEVLPSTRPQNNWSLTELGTGFTLMPDEAFDDKVGSVGQPVEPLQVRVVDPDTGDEVPTGERGEVLARVEGRRRREYFRAPELDEQAWDDGWFHTGDLGRLDEDGFLWIEGRTDDMIIRGGHNVHPGDTEAALYEDDRVQEAAVVGVPAGDEDEAVVAFVVPRPGTELAADDLHASLEGRLGEPKYPDRIEIVDALPRNTAGKVLRRELAEEATRPSGGDGGSPSP